MAKRTIKANRVIADIRAGLTNSELMAIYGLSPKNLDTVFRRLLKDGSITRAELAARHSDIDDLIEVTNGDSSAASSERTDKTENGPPAHTFSGRVECVDILDYIQLLLMDGRKALLEVRSLNNEQCKLFLDGGRILHAQSDDVDGAEAFYKCIQFPGGEFFHLPWIDPDRISMDEGGTFFLIEAARRRDESNAASSTTGVDGAVA